MCRWACWAWLRVGLLSQSKAFQLYSGSFGNVNNLWKLNFNLWLVFTHHTWKRNANEHQHKKAERKKKLCFWCLTQAKQLWQENYIKTQVVACAAARVSANLFQVTTSWNVFRLPVLCDLSSRNTPCSRCCLPLKRMSQKHSFPVDMQHTDVEWREKKKKKKTTLRIHRRFELLHPDEFHLVVVLTAMNQKMGP